MLALLRRVVVVLDDDVEHTKLLTGCLERYGASVVDVEFDRDLEVHQTRLEVDVRLPDRSMLDKLLTELTKSPGVRRIKVRRLG